MTKYRIVSNGYYSYLQYLYEYKSLGFWSRKVWKYICKPSNDSKSMFNIEPNERLNYCSLHDDLRNFVKRWPDIKLYFEWASDEQRRINKIKEEIEKNVERKRKEIIYL